MRYKKCKSDVLIKKFSYKLQDHFKELNIRKGFQKIARVHVVQLLGKYYRTKKSNIEQKEGCKESQGKNLIVINFDLN